MAQPKYRLQGTPKLGLSVIEVAEAMGCSKAFLYGLWSKGKGPRRAKIGGRTIVRPEWIQEYLQECEVA
jgi:predicted DNA-binding transcriptional regulator AlpA